LKIETLSLKEAGQSRLFLQKFGVAQTTLFTIFLKGAIFAVGILIIGVFEPRTVVSSCSSNMASPVNVYQFEPWAHVEAYTDYRDLYLPCLIQPFLQGTMIYHLSIVYNYPPLFLYLIAGFAAMANIIWLPAFPLVFFDILTVIPLYLISKEFVFHNDSRLAFFTAVFWAANPINLFYNDLMWLNTAPTTFFLVLSIYLFLKQRPFYSSLALALSTGFKQISVILFPVLLILMWKTKEFSKKGVLVFTATYFVSLVLISTPYIFNDTQNYFYSLNFPIFGNPAGAPNNPPQFSTALSEPVRITTFLGSLSSSMGEFVTKSYQILDYVFAACFVVFLISLLIKSRSSEIDSQEKLEGGQAIDKRKGLLKTHSSILRKFSQSIRNFGLKRNLSSNEVLVYCLIAFLIFLALFGRGVYKYYFASITPLGIPMFRFKFGAVIFEVISIVLLLVPREATPWMAVLLLTFVPSMLEGRF
jgi:hypothetical protein